MEDDDSSSSKSKAEPNLKAGQPQPEPDSSAFIRGGEISQVQEAAASPRPSTAPVGGAGTGAGVSSPPPAKKSPNDFIFGKLLGEGSFSSVYLAKDVKTGKEFAIKVCDKQHIIRERKAESIRREKEVLTILSGNRSTTAPFFVHLYATFQDHHRLYFVVTFAPGGELLKYLHKAGSFDLDCCRFYSAEILQALRHLHTVGIVHRDLKPKNILLDEHGHILITDFGSAKIHTTKSGGGGEGESVTSTSSGSSQSSTATSTSAPTDSGEPQPPSNSRNRSNSFVGTAQYVSPEVLKGRYTEVGPPADLWAFGCILFQLVAGILPFQANNEFLIFQKILKLEYQFPPEFQPQVKDLIERLLKLEPNERLGATDDHLYHSIQSHPFFIGVDFDKLWEQTPPVISQTTAASTRKQKSQRDRDTNAIPETYQPGFDPRVIAERVLKSEQDDFSFGGEDDDDEDDEDSDTDGDGGVADGMGKLSVAGDGSKGSPTERSVTLTSPKSVQLPRNDVERRQRLEEQLRKNPGGHAAVKGNLILKQGLVSKKKGLFARKRILFLTEGPHLFYCEPSTLHVKGEIPWGKELRPEAKDFKIFFIHPNRTYYLEDPDGYALEWCRVINEIHHELFANSPATPSSPN